MTERAHLVRTRILAAVLLLVTFVTLASCSSNPSRTYDLTIPEGTWKTKDASVLADLPQRRTPEGVVVLRFARGDTLTVYNGDKLTHQIGMVAVRPGETVQHTFTQTGSFEGSCTMLAEQRVVIEVT